MAPWSEAPPIGSSLSDGFYLCRLLLFQEYEEPVYSYSTYPDRQYSSSTSQHFKMSPLFASSEGVSGYRYQSDDAHRTQPPRHSLSTRIRERVYEFALTHSHFPFAYFAYFKNTKNLFIHIALIPIGDIPRVHPNILKCLHYSPVAKGLVVIATRAMMRTERNHHVILYPLAYARGCVNLRSHILIFLLLILLISHHIQP